MKNPLKRQYLFCALNICRLFTEKILFTSINLIQTTLGLYGRGSALFISIDYDPYYLITRAVRINELDQYITINLHSIHV